MNSPSAAQLEEPDQTQQNSTGILRQGSPGRRRSDNSKELSDRSHTPHLWQVTRSMLTNDRLKDLDTVSELAKQVQITSESIQTRIPVNNVLDRGPELDKLAELQHATSQSLLSLLNVIEVLGDRAVAAGETHLAEIAYMRVLDAYRGHPSPVSSFVRRLLMKMASFYRNTDQPHRAENCWWEIFKWRDPACQAQGIEKEVWQRLATSLSQTSRIISETIRSEYPDLFPPLNLETPFPPIHTLIKHENASIKLHKPRRSDSTSQDMSLSRDIHEVMAGGPGNVIEIIKEAPDFELATRDILSRSLLYLAAFLKREDAGYALMARMETLSPAIRNQRMNARDLSGQTILGIATISGCSAEFITALIDHGAKIDPDDLLKDPLTPLQAACMNGSPEIVDIFLRHGADVNRVYPGNLTPAQLAQVFGNDKIIQLITTKASGSSSAALFAQPHSAIDGRIANTVGNHSGLPIDATMSDVFRDYGFASPSDLSSTTP
jgi:hypothetical protein